MTIGRVIGGVVASAAVAGCAVVVLGMSHTAGDVGGTVPGAAPGAGFTMPVASAARASWAPLPTTAVPTVAPAAAGSSAVPTPMTRPVTTAPRMSASPAPASTVAATPIRTTPRPAPRTTTVARPAPVRTTAQPRPRAATVQSGVPLPLHYSTGTATRVITVTAPSRSRTTARLQAWTKAAGGGWRRYGTAVTAHIGADGMSTHPSESRSATPIGSFTLTLAFGRNADPGTSLPYFRTRPSDWWISQPGPLYNTHQRCSSGCRFTQGDPNEHLYYETPYYNYAVVIDYNTRNAPGGVRQGAGSAFFLHVTDGTATAGCVAIPQSRLIPLMRWLTPSAHPRILIGVA